ncbi:SNF2 domain-containing protein / helicase domain-containing protein isoform X2 [Wolffia australiana]
MPWLQKPKGQKALEAPKEPPRRKTHWDYVLEEMVWLSKDFESERKWKLSQAKKVAVRVIKNTLDPATKEEKKFKEEEQRLKKLASNIAKDVKKFWIKIEKLVSYKHQLELEEKKKKALDKQLDFLLDQTERYSTMLAENLMEKQHISLPEIEYAQPKQEEIEKHLADKMPDVLDNDAEYDIQPGDDIEDDEHTLEEDEALITEEERREELEALKNEVDLPIAEILKRYRREDNPESPGYLSAKSPMSEDESSAQEAESSSVDEQEDPTSLHEERDGDIIADSVRKSPSPENLLLDSSDEMDDRDFVGPVEEEKDDETTLAEEEELSKNDQADPLNEIELLQREGEMPIEELLARYKMVDVEHASSSSDTSEGVDYAEETRIAVEEESVRKDLEGEDIIADAAAAARSAQPTGNTFSTTKVRTKVPFLLKHPLREYQHIGLDWLVTMYEKRLNGILADEMGLGKTIMTISLLAHLACEKGIWGPHLIVVPTSVMLNWETEFLKWCPAFKILTYFGTAKERKNKRQGWLKPNYFHVCITTYRLVIQDAKVFKRKKWKYLILDEAHLIKNWKSQRWQTLLNFNSKRRILLTGTPLQNDLMELWSLMHFLMPHIFQSHQEFKDWFSNPISGMVEGQEKVNKEVVDRLHNVLRPFILRRLKRDVEKQLPRKHEHVIYCRLSKRQRNLYEDFIASSETQATLASSNFFGMISVIMQLRKVCNHPDLFEGRPIISSFDMPGIDMQLNSAVCSILTSGPFSGVDLEDLNLVFTQNEYDMPSWEFDEVKDVETEDEDLSLSNIGSGNSIFDSVHRALLMERSRERKERAASIAWWNSLRCQRKPVYGSNLRELLTIKHPVVNVQSQKMQPSCYLSYSSLLSDLVLQPVERLQTMLDVVESFMFAIPPARAPSPVCWWSRGSSSVFLSVDERERWREVFNPLLSPLRPAMVRRQVYFPDRRLIQFDCGKLQKLAVLLRRLKSEGHRALIFTQMTKMLDILEAFINIYGYTYLRLDGSTLPEERQTLMQRFNTNPKIFLFILSTRSGGVGINLVGADTVIFYDSDWNPAMDQQAQDRCHRIGQTREVHIYRLISESTIEENILKKANQKRVLDDLVIQSGSYNTEFFKKLDPMELFKERLDDLSNADVEAALKQAEDEVDYMALKKVEQEEEVENQEFTEETNFGKLEEDEIVNEDEVKADTKAEEQSNALDDVNNVMVLRTEEEIDMLADVKQMAAAAAAAGEASSSFENQLRPIDRYAMRFLDLWDPVINKSAIEGRDNVAEEEWELDRIERFKDDLEAESDEDEEPILYESWDVDFATEAYRQHVEALAQQQMIEDLEFESEEPTAIDAGIGEPSSQRKPKTKKKTKKSKLKSLKRGTGPMEDDQAPQSISKKRKELTVAIEDEEPPRKPPKKARKGSGLGDNQGPETLEARSGDEMSEDLRPPIRLKLGGKISITPMPVKRVMVVKPEKFRKKGNIWSKDCIPSSSDAWSPLEDAILCAVVHEYSTNWRLVSDALYSVSTGGFYRGIFRHPVHCCERFRELFFKYVACGVEGAAPSNLGKTLLRVTEEQVAMLLTAVCDQPDLDFLLQKHFAAILSLVWKAKFLGSYSLSSSSLFSATSTKKKPRKFTEKMNSVALAECGRLVASSLDNAGAPVEDAAAPMLSEEDRSMGEQLELTLEFPVDSGETAASFPSLIMLTIADPPQQGDECTSSKDSVCRSSSGTSEDRFRTASRACIEGEGPGWATSAFSAGPTRQRGGPKHRAVNDSLRPSKAKTPTPAELDVDLVVDLDVDLGEIQAILAVEDAWDGPDRAAEAEVVDSEVVDSDYDPSFIAGLEDLDLPETVEFG